MVADAFGPRALDDALTVYPDAPVSDLPGLDGHPGTWPFPGCEFPADVADGHASGVRPGLDRGPPELIGICCSVPDHESAAGRQVAAQEPAPSVWQLREGEDREIDFVLERPGGAVVGIEVEATTSPGADTARHLRWFTEKIGDRFQAGMVFHLGSRPSSFGDAIQAVRCPRSGAMPRFDPWHLIGLPVASLSAFLPTSARE
jgi:hypothetical protein